MATDDVTTFIKNAQIVSKNNSDRNVCVTSQDTDKEQEVRDFCNMTLVVGRTFSSGLSAENMNNDS